MAPPHGPVLLGSAVGLNILLRRVILTRYRTKSGSRGGKGINQKAAGNCEPGYHHLLLSHHQAEGSGFCEEMLFVMFSLEEK